MTDPEQTRWVQWAAECAERVLPLAGEYRAQSEAAIQAARAWAESPTEERRQACEQISAILGGELEVVRIEGGDTPEIWAAGAAAQAAAAASDSRGRYRAESERAADYAAEAVAGVAANAMAHRGPGRYGAVYRAAISVERERQAMRARAYGLPAPNAGATEG